MSLRNTPLGRPEQFSVVVEIPKGSEKKIEYDEKRDQMFMDFIFQNDFRFIFNYGFIPQTKAGDDDTLDVILLGSKPIASGTVVLARPVGIMRMLDRGVQDDKVLAVPIHDPETERYQSIQDVSEEERQRFKVFYSEVGRQKQKTIEITGFEDKDQAVEEIKKSMI